MIGKNWDEDFIRLDELPKRIFYEETVKLTPPNPKETTMKIDTNYVLRDFAGTALKTPATFDTEGKVATTRDMTFGIAASESLLGQFQSENIQAAEKIARYELAKRLSQNTAMDLTIDEATKIKYCVNLNYPTLVVGQVNDYLEGAAKPQQTAARDIPNLDDQHNDDTSHLTDKPL